MHEEIQSELDALTHQLRRSATIDTQDGELLAYSVQRDDTDPARVSSILKRRSAPAVRRWERLHLGDQPTEPVTIPANADLGMSARRCVPLVHHGRGVGLLYVLLGDHPLSQEHGRMVERAAARLAALLGSPNLAPGHDARPGRATDRLVRRLVEGGDPAAVDALSGAVNGRAGTGLLLVVALPVGDGRSRPFSALELDDLDERLTLSLRARADVLGSYVTDDHAVVVLHGVPGPESPSRTLDAIDRVLARSLTSPSTLGVSDTVPLAPGGVREGRAQALAAAELAILDPALDRRSVWSNLGAYRLLTTSEDRADLVLAPLDDAGSSSAMLLETLEVFLDLAGDVQRVAARLTLHRSSLYYRLSRITTLLRIDLSDGLTRLELHLALKQRRAARRVLS